MKPFQVCDDGGATANGQNAHRMKALGRQIAGFSLVEVTLALGVAAICLLALLALLPVASKTQQTSIQQTTANQIISQINSVLRADVSLPPGQANKVCPDPPDPNAIAPARPLPHGSPKPGASEPGHGAGKRHRPPFPFARRERTP